MSRELLNMSGTKDSSGNTALNYPKKSMNQSQNIMIHWGYCWFKNWPPYMEGRGQREMGEGGRPLLMGRWKLEEQGNVHMRLDLGASWGDLCTSHQHLKRL